MALKEGLHPSYLGWQMDWPVFVKVPFNAFGQQWRKSQPFNWHGMFGANPEKIAQLYAQGFIYHNKTLEVENKVGDRLSEMNAEDLRTLVVRMNTKVKSVTTTAKEFNQKKCKQSKYDDKQRGLIRAFLRNNDWIVDYFYEQRDDILGE